MAKKVTLENLGDVISDILDEYADDIAGEIPEITEKIGKAGVQAIRNSSRSSFKGTGKYAKGWNKKVEHKRLWSEVTIYNKSLPGLPHLLEHGHATRGGGRTPGKVHISPVEEKLVQNYEKEIINAIK